MKPTTEESKIINLNLRTMSWKKGEEKEITVIEGVTKNSVFEEKMELKAFEADMRSNDTLETETGRIMQFKKGSFNIVKENNEYCKMGKPTINVTVEKQKTGKEVEIKLIDFVEYVKNKRKTERDIG